MTQSPLHTIAISIGDIVHTATYGKGKVIQTCPKIPGSEGTRYLVNFGSEGQRFVHERSITEVITAAGVDRDRPGFEVDLTEEIDALFNGHELVPGTVLDFSLELEAELDGAGFGDFLPSQGAPSFPKAA